MSTRAPAYLSSHASGKLREKIAAAREMLRACRLCPRKCGVDRSSGELGFCNTGQKAVVASYNPHFGEEDPLVGAGGSGTVFFSHCNLRCRFCQNYDISHEGCGRPLSDDQLAAAMIRLQEAGCHNINLVTPSHVVPQILSALDRAVAMGLSIPLVYNTGGYDRVETLQLLADVIDVYMPDFKIWDTETARKICEAPDYPQKARAALLEMHRQVGDLIIDTDGIARRGLLVRHLVLPGGLAGTREIMRFIAEAISPNTYVNIMPQYRPCGRAHEIAELSRPLAPDEFAAALQTAQTEGIHRLDRRRRKFEIW